MNTLRKPIPSLALVALLGITTTASAQFSRGPINPYSSSTSAGNNSFTPTSSAFGQRASVTYGGWGPIFPYSVTYFAPQYGSLTINFQYGKPFYTTGPSYLYGMGGGYSYGGTSSTASYNSYTPNSSVPARVEAPRKAFDRWVAQRQISPEEAQKQQKQEELARSLNNPSSGNLTSGQALNAVLDSLSTMLDKVKATPEIPFEEQWLTRINFTRGTGSSGMLQGEGKIVWPTLLMQLGPKDEVGKIRLLIELRFREVFKQVSEGEKADPENVKTLLKLIDQLSDLATVRTSSMSFADNLEVRRYLRSLEDSVTFLKQEDASDWLPGKLKIKPKSVQELVVIMNDKGIRFAPALVGNDAIYARVHQLLAGLHEQVAR